MGTNIVSLKRNWQHWAARINGAWQKSAEAILETGRLLIEAKSELDHGQFESMVEMELSFDASTAQRIMKVAAHPVISKPAHVQLLPPSWGTLYELTKIDTPVLEAKIADGTINPKTERKDVVALRGIIPSKTKHKKKIRPRGASRAQQEPDQQEKKHEEDLRRLQVAWEVACQSARNAFMSEIGVS